MTDAYRPEDDPILGRLRRREEQATRQAYTDPLAPNPEEAANVRRLSEESGLPEANIFLDLGAGERAAQAAQAERALQTTPRLREWIADPRNSTVARDDIESLSVFERARAAHLRGDHFRALGPVVGDILAPLALPLDPMGAAAHIRRRQAEGSRDPFGNEQQRQGDLDVEQSMLGYRRGEMEAEGADLSAEELARLDELAVRPGRDDWGPFIIGPTRRLIPQLVGQFRQGGVAAGAGYSDVMDRAIFNDYAGPETREAIERGEPGAVAGAVARGAAASPLAAIVGAGHGLAGFYSFGFEMETGSVYDEMRRSGIEAEIAWPRAQEYGAWATALEFAGDALGAKLSGAGRLAARTFLRQSALQATNPALRAAGGVAGGAVAEGPTEAAQQLAQIIHQDLAQQEAAGGDADVGAAWRAALTPESIEQILHAGYIGAQGGGGMAVVPAGVNYGLDIRAAQRAEQNAATFEEWTRASQASKLSERGLVSTLESAVGAMDDSNVYIDADQWLEHFQGANADPYAVAEELGIGAENLAQAVASHGQVQMPTSTFAARVLRLPEHAKLAEHARISPTDMTPAEAKAADEVFRAEVEQLAAEVETATTDNEIGAIVETRMRELFAAAAEEGGPRSAVSARYAKLVAAMPRALLARARATDPVYAQRLEGQLRTLFGQDLDIAGPAREAATEGTPLEQRGSGPDAGPARSDRWEPPEGVNLTERQRSIVEMAANGASNEWIAQEWETTENSVAATLAQTKRKLGGQAPWEEGGRLGPAGHGGWMSAQLVEMRARGLTTAQIAERTGISPNSVKVRISEQRKRVREQNRRAEPFDLHTPEGRAVWFKQEVLAEPIPGEASDARQYGFALDNGDIVVVKVEPEPTGAATFEWAFLDRLKNADPDADPFEQQKGRLGRRGALALMARLTAVLEADMAQFRRDAYYYTPYTRALEAVNKRLVNRIIGHVPYSTVDDGNGSYYIVRDGADIAQNGQVLPSPENENAEPIDWPSVDPAEVEALQAGFHERLERFAKGGAAEGDGSDGGRTGDVRGSAGVRGGVAGTGGTRTDDDGSEDLGQGEARGSIRYDKFKAGEFGEAVIRLGEASDLSTFLHEFGHLGHLILESIATDPEAPAEFKAMWENTLSWWGVSQEEWSVLAPEAKVEHFERWARTFEAYLMEGKAPSLGLREAFAAFKEWLKRIYTSLFRLDHNLNPEIRDVFDRLLATDAEMAEARAAQGADFTLSREAFATEEEFAQYQQAISEARDAQEAELRARVMDAHARKSKRWWRGERERMRPAAARHVDSDPARRAEQWLGAGEWRPLPETTLSDEGETGYVAPADALEEMPEGLPEMRLSAEALAADWPDAQLPPAVAPRTDVETVLAEAMALKAVSKGRGPARAARLWLFIKNNGGINLTGLSEERRAAFMAAIGSGQKRPGLINNKDGKTPEELMALAAQAGYFGKGAARELRQPPIDPSAPRAPGEHDFFPVDPDTFNRVHEEAAYNARQAGYENIPTTEVPISSLTGTQRGIRDDFRTTPLLDPEDGLPALAYRAPDGKLYLTDGHNRVAAAAARGETTVPVKIYSAPRAPEGALEGTSFTNENLNPEIIAIIDEHFGPGMADAALADKSGATMLEFADDLMREGETGAQMAAVASMEEWALAQRAASTSREMVNVTPRAPEGGGDLKQGGELFSDKAPSLEEFMAALTADLKNERQVYSAKDPEALASAQNLQDAQAWFDANEIDLTKPKEEIRAEIVAALERAKDDPSAVHPDTAAEFFGFSSGDHLIQALSALKPRAVAIEDRIDSMVEEEHGDAASPDKIQEAARLAAHVEAQSRRIEMELAALQKATGGRARPVGRAARKYAEQQVARMSVREVRNYERFLAGERRAARNAADEAAKGNHGEAARQKSKQLISFHLYRFARDAAEEMERAQRYFQKFDRPTIRANIHPPLMDQIDQTLEGVDLRVTPRISNRRRQNFLAWYAEMQAEGLDHMVAVDPAFLAEVQRRPFASLSVEEARAMRDAIKNFEHIGRRWREVLSARGKRLMEEAVTEMVDAIDANGQIISEKRKGFSPDTLEYLNEQRLRFHAEHTKPEFLFRLLDGLKDAGPVWSNLFAPIARAEDAEMEMRNASAARMSQIFSAYSRSERGRLFVKKRFITAIGRSMTKAEILSVALNWGNEGNRQAMVEGYQWNDQQVRSILDELDQRDWRAVKDIWAWLEEYREPSFALQERLTGVRPAAVEGMEVATNFGPVQGAYYPLRYDPEQGERAFRREEQSKTLEEWGSNWIRPQTRQGHLQARVGSGGQKVRLDLSVLTEHVENVIHDITHREAVIGTLRFIENKRLQEAMIAAVGRQQYRQLRPWLSRIAADVKDPSTVWERVLLRLRMGASVVNMGWKITTAIVQPLGLLNSLPRVGGGALAKSLINFYAQPHKMREAIGFVFERSTFMKNRMATFDRDVRDALNRIRGKAERDAVPVGVRQSFFWMTGVMDMSVSVPTWLAAYDNAMSGKVDNIAANDPKAAAEHADSVVRTTQGAGGVKDLTGYTGSKREIMRLFTMFYSYMSNLYNQLYVEQAGGLSGGIVPLHVFIGNMFVLWFLPAVGAVMLQGRWEPDDDETDEERLTRIGLEVAAYPLFTMVGVRDIVNGVITPYDYTMTPVSEALERTVGAGRRVVGAIDNDGAIDEDELRGILKDMTLATGYWLAIPARQLWITGEYLTDVATGEEAPPWEDPEAAYEEGLLRDRR